MNLDKDDTTLLHISWGNIYTGAQAMVAYISRTNHPDIVISTQEDAIAAQLVCSIAKLPLCIAHLNGKTNNGIIINCMPKIDMPIRSGVYNQHPQPEIAIISTLIDNYNHVNELVAYYQKRGHKVRVLSLYSRKEVDNPPEYNWVKVTKTTKFVFPWQEL